MIVTKTEIEEILRKIKIQEYYIEIDMNGAMSVYLSSRYSECVNVIIKEIESVDNKRSNEDIYRMQEIFYPLKRVEIDDDTDEITLSKLSEKEFIKARYSQQLNSWVTQSQQSKGRIPRVAFYSYKGGVGRSTTLAIVARLLAREGFKVAVIDLDLEAPGLNSLLLTKQKPSPFGVVDYLYHIPWMEDMEKQRFLSQYIVKEDVPRRNKKPGQIIVMPAGGTKIEKTEHQLNYLFDDEQVNLILEPNYLNKLSYIDFDVYSRQTTNVFDRLLDDMAQHSGADIILIDARTGFSNISGALLSHFSDVLSIHVQNNRQNKEGIEFIAKHIGKTKLKNAIWSNTKVNENKSSQELLNFIKKKVYNQPELNEISTPIYFELPYDNHLDNIDSYKLKFYIDRYFSYIMPYAELSEQIIEMTGLDKKLPDYVDDDTRNKILIELKDLISKDNNDVLYISQRFLAEDLELFVGFPGSGKKTFSNYMEKEYHKDIQVVNFEHFKEMDNSAYHILSHTIFLDWNIDEAAQAICKWFLQSPSFMTLIKNNKLFSELLDPEEIDKMLESPEYELDLTVLNEILELIFQENKRTGGWRSIFARLQYREGYVLPNDILTGIKNYVSFWIEKFKKEKRSSKKLRSLFPAINPLPVRELWREIGEQKGVWLKNYDKNLYRLVIEIKKQKQETVEHTKLTLSKQFDHLSADEFENLFEKAVSLELIRKKMLKEYDVIMLTPVYQLISDDD